jgi:hypothetical protein
VVLTRAYPMTATAVPMSHNPVELSVLRGYETGFQDSPAGGSAWNWTRWLAGRRSRITHRFRDALLLPQ